MSATATISNTAAGDRAPARHVGNAGDRAPARHVGNAGDRAPAPARHVTSAWYAVQVATGREARACELIREADDAGVLDEVFVPRKSVGVYDEAAKAWVYDEQTMFPGYLIVTSRRAGEIAPVLARARGFARVLGDGEGAVRLPDAEVAVLDAFMQGGRRCVMPSTGRIEEGGRVVILEGPLVGREALIEKIKHRQKRAVIRMKFCGRDVLTEVALHVVRARR